MRNSTLSTQSSSLDGKGGASQPASPHAHPHCQIYCAARSGLGTYHVSTRMAVSNSCLDASKKPPSSLISLSRTSSVREIRINPMRISCSKKRCRLPLLTRRQQRSRSPVAINHVHLDARAPRRLALFTACFQLANLVFPSAFER